MIITPDTVENKKNADATLLLYLTNKTKQIDNAENQPSKPVIPDSSYYKLLHFSVSIEILTICIPHAMIKTKPKTTDGIILFNKPIGTIISPQQKEIHCNGFSCSCLKVTTVTFLLVLDILLI